MRHGEAIISARYKLPTSDGSAGQVIRTDGAGTCSWAGVSTTPNMQIFTSSAMWTRPGGVTTVDVECVGGGGGGDSAGNYTGGGGGAYVRKIVTVSGDVMVTIGAGGNQSGNNPATPGLPTAFGGLVIASGAMGAGVGGLATGGDINIDGETTYWKYGGDSPLGFGRGGKVYTSGVNIYFLFKKWGFGAGGSCLDYPNCNGLPGVCIVRW